MDCTTGEQLGCSGLRCAWKGQWGGRAQGHYLSAHHRRQPPRRWLPTGEWPFGGIAYASACLQRATRPAVPTEHAAWSSPDSRARPSAARGPGLLHDRIERLQRALRRLAAAAKGRRGRTVGGGWRQAPPAGAEWGRYMIGRPTAGPRNAAAEKQGVARAPKHGHRRCAALVAARAGAGFLPSLFPPTACPLPSCAQSEQACSYVASWKVPGQPVLNQHITWSKETSRLTCCMFGAGGHAAG